uniref:Lectin-domain containing receptor kinase A4.3 n=1 Tax=Aegilops tauschii TaxID=37682 RepID=M8BAK0_AEGTA
MKHTSFFQHFIFLFGLVVTTLASGDDQFLVSGFNQQPSLTLDGCAVVTYGGLLDLSNGTTGVNGHAFYPTPLHFRKSPGGMAFFIAPATNFSDAQGAKYFGLLNEKNNGNTRNRFVSSCIFEAISTMHEAEARGGVTPAVQPHIGEAAELDAMQLRSRADVTCCSLQLLIPNPHRLPATGGLCRPWGGTGEARGVVRLWEDKSHRPAAAGKSGVAVKLGSGEAVRRLRATLVLNCGGFLQFTPRNHIFMVELDTFKHVELQDINDNHIGININSAVSLQPRTAGFYEDEGGAFNNMMLNGTKAMQLWVDYDEGDTQINVTLAPINMGKPSRPLLSATYDLSTVLSGSASYIGFSASYSRNTHRYVMGWSFGMNRPAPSIDISKLPKLPLIGPKAQPKLLGIVLPIATAILILAMGTLVTLVDWEGEFGPYQFSYKDLFHATGEFKNKHLLGEGGFGKVYKGVLPSSNVEIVVKRMPHESRQGMKEFVTEVVSIGQLRHRNLVQLLGYCRKKRFRVIKGISTGLLYLHENWEKIVIHRDIKASNVLLDGEMNGPLGDFGLARLYEHRTFFLKWRRTPGFCIIMMYASILLKILKVAQCHKNITARKRSETKK